MNELIEKNGKRGLKLLFIFKNLKRVVTDRIIEKYSYSSMQNYEGEINKKCIMIAREILDRNEEDPSEGDIKKVLDSLRNL